MNFDHRDTHSPLKDIIRRTLSKLGVGIPKTLSSARERLRVSQSKYGGEPPQIKPVLGPAGEVTAWTATVEATPESVETLSQTEVEQLNADASEIQYFFQAFLGRTLPDWTLADLDLAFEVWHQSTDRGRFSPQVVTRITGAAFGNYCNCSLDMRWLAITDLGGRDLAVRTQDDRVTGFPFSTVTKRIDDKETGFFVPVFNLLKQSAAAG